MYLSARIGLISLIGEVLVMTVMKAPVPIRPRGQSTANQIRFDQLGGSQKRPLHTWILGVCLRILFMLILLSTVIYSVASCGFMWEKFGLFVG
jgi:hypothetical protein